MITTVLVCGGRKYATTVKQRQHVWDTLDAILAHYGEVIIIHGGAPGADSYAGVWADAKDAAHNAPVRAKWNRLGPPAGPLRNRAMLALTPGIVVAFPGGPGTADMVGQALKAGIPVYEIEDHA